MKTSLRSISLCFFITLSLTGCSNLFKESYESNLERWPSGEVSRLQPFDGTVRLVTSTNMKNDALRMMENGYLLIGRSRFRSSYVEPEAARSLAQDIGASVVLFEKKYAETLTGTTPINEWIPEKEVVVKQIDVIRSGPDAGKVIEREVTRKIQGEFRTTYVPQSTDYYNFAATYWAKSKPPIFGVLVEALSDSLRQQIQSNKGVVVQAVINDSPAFSANILRHDVITKFADEEVINPDQFFDLVVHNSGRSIQAEINRNGELKTISIQLKME